MKALFSTIANTTVAYYDFCMKLSNLLLSNQQTDGNLRKNTIHRGVHFGCSFSSLDDPRPK
ncbi:hypothetical protein MARINOS108_140026 [Marinoscillum sp. 108]|nr:hypothetical protein MARINOS108_140026 [Marinoscillum sp. 108]